MFTRIWNYLLGIEHHAVDVIVSDFHKVVDRLKAAAEAHYEVAVDAAVKASHLKDIEAAALTEVARAKTIAANVEALVTSKVA
jgi:hypothetical protein